MSYKYECYDKFDCFKDYDCFCGKPPCPKKKCDCRCSVREIKCPREKEGRYIREEEPCIDKNEYAYPMCECRDIKPDGYDDSGYGWYSEPAVQKGCGKAEFHHDEGAYPCAEKDYPIWEKEPYPWEKECCCKKEVPCPRDKKCRHPKEKFRCYLVCCKCLRCRDH